MMFHSKAQTAIIAALAALSTLAHADTITVGPDLGIYDHQTIAAAIGAAANNDEIVIEPGLYPENLVIGKQLTLRRSDTPGTVVISGQNLARVIEALPGVSLTLRGLTITQGSSGNDAGIRAPSGNLIVEDCIIEDNHAISVTGGLYSGGSLTMRNTIVRNNTSPTFAGGVALKGTGPHLIENCVFEGNTAGTTDTSTHHSGAISVDLTVGQAVVRDTIFINNSTTGRGGAVSAINRSVRFDRCIFDSNTAPRGGAVWISDADSAEAYNCLFVDNTATSFGGAVFNEQEFEAVNSTFVSNTDSTDGNTFEGFRSDARTLLFNSIVVNPSPDSHSGTGTYAGFYSLIPEAPAFPSRDVFNSFNADPSFVDAPAGDFRLNADSPAIDAADSFASGSLNSTNFPTSQLVDLDANIRNLDNPSTPNIGVPAWQLNIDMGAYEFQPAPPTGPGCSPVDLAPPYGVINFFDVSSFLSQYQQGCP